MKTNLWRSFVLDPISEGPEFRRGLCLGLFLVALVTIACLLFGASRPTKAKFHVGQVFAVSVADTAVNQYFRVGYIDQQSYSDGTPYFRYTDATERIDGEWPEDSLRALTKDECH